MDIRQAVRWTLQHGAVRLLLGQAAGRGDPQARLIMDPAVRADPYLLLDTVRAQGVLVRGRLSWVTASHAACQDVLRSNDFRSGPPPTPFSGLVSRISSWSRPEQVLHPLEPPSLLAVEPPEHTRYRRQVSRVFTARAVEALRENVQRTADRLLDALAATTETEVDLVEHYATLLPLTVISDLLGVPESDRALVLEFGNGLAPSVDIGISWAEFTQTDASLLGFDAWLGRHLQRLRENPGADVLSQLVCATEDGEHLTEAELRSTAGLLLAAGFGTTVNLLGSGTELLLRHPEQLTRLQRSPELWGNAIEEILRYESPVQVTGRVALRDTEVQGVTVGKGELVATLLAGANRDPAVFDNPGAFDVDRQNAREHVAFSAGRHFCLGAALARIEGEVALRTLFERFPGLALTPGAERQPTKALRGWARLPVHLGVPVA